MNAKSWRWLLILLGVLLLYVVVVERPWQDNIRGPKAKVGAHLFAGLDPAALTAIEIHSGGKLTRLEKDAGAWVVASEARFPADEKAVTDLIARVDTLKGGPVVSDNPGRRGTFGVDTSGVEVTFHSGGKAPAHFWVGGSSPDFSGSFVRPEGGDKVYAIGGLSKYQFERTGQGWRDRNLFKFDAEAVQKLTLTHADSTITLTRQGGDSLLASTWRLESNQPKEAPGTPRHEMVVSLVRQLANLNADAFPAAGDAGPASWTPLAGRVLVELKGGETHELDFGPLDAKGQQHYVRLPGVMRGGQAPIYLMGSWRFKSLARPYADMAPAASPPAAGGAAPPKPLAAKPPPLRNKLDD